MDISDVIVALAQGSLLWYNQKEENQQQYQQLLLTSSWS